MKSPAQVIRKMLLDLAVVSAHTASEWATFVSFLPEKPDKAICVYDSQGSQDGRIQKTGERVDHPGIQVMVRGTDYEETYEKANTVATTLDAQKNVSVAFPDPETYTVHNVSRSSTVLSLGMEEYGSKRLFYFSINAVVTLKQT